MIVLTATAILHKSNDVICENLQNGPDDMVGASVHQLIEEAIHRLDEQAVHRGTSLRVLTITAEDLGRDGL